MHPHEAVEIVARHVIASCVEDQYGEMWEQYPDLKAYDWDEVCDEVENRLRRVIRVPAAKFDEAYEVLRAQPTPLVIP